MKIKIKLCSCKAEFIDLCSFFQQIKEDVAFHFVFVENKMILKNESNITMMRKPYNYGDLEVVKGIITRKFIITQNNHDYELRVLLKNLLMKVEKNMKQQRISQALLSYHGSKKTHNVQSNLLLLY